MLNEATGDLSMSDTLPCPANHELPMLYVVIDMKENEFHGAYCNESTAYDRQYNLSWPYPDGEFKIVA